MKRFFRSAIISAVLLLCATLLSAADPSGKWKGAFDVNGTPLSFVLELKSDAGKLTGTVTPGANPAVEMKDVKLEGSVLTFTFTTDYNGNAVHLIARAELGTDEVKVSMRLDDGSWSTEFAVKKV